MEKSIWDKTDQELSAEIAKGNKSEIHKQTVFLMEILKQVGEAIEANKTVRVENIVRQVVGQVAVSRPDWIKELIQDTKPLEKKLDYIASVIIRKEVVKEMKFARPDWIEELVPKDFVFPDSKDFSKPTVDVLKEILKAVNEKEVVEAVSIKGEVEIKKPAWFEFPDIDKPFVALAGFIKKYFDKAILKTEVTNEITISNPVKAIEILNQQKEISINNLKKIEDSLKLMNAQLAAMGTTGSNSAGGGGSTYDASGNKINPATEDTLQGVATEETLQAGVDIFIKYKSVGMDVSGTPMYFGYIALDGSWYIKALDTASGTTYCKGDSGYSTAWTGRAGLTYGEFDVIFG